jgi:hypothetical protein
MRAQAAPRHGRLIAGLTLLTMTFAGAVAAVGPAAAEPAEEGSASPLEIIESALYASPVFDAVPPTAKNQIPPEAVCVVEPRLCPQESEAPRNALVEGVKTVGDNFPVEPIQPVPEDTAAVSFFGGHTRYQTAVRFDVPGVPQGDEIFAFTVQFDQSQPSYDLNSPAFRRVVLGAFSSLGPQDPSFFVEGLVDALQQAPLEVDGDVIGIEACPLLAPFEPAGAPQASHADTLPQREVSEDETEVDVDCILGSSGVRGDDGVWSFDLTFAAAAWAAGDIENHGVLLRPSGAPNLAFGDPDTTTNAQVVLDLTDVRASMETAEAMDDVTGFEEMSLEDDASFEEAAFEEDAGFDEASFEEDASFAPDDPVDAGLSDAPDLDAEFADGEELTAGPMVDGQAGGGGAVDTVAAGGGNPVNPWWIWLLVPAFFGGAYLTSQALTGPAAATAGATQSGALSRLIAQRSRAASDPLQQV